MDRQRLSGHEGSELIVIKGRVQGVGFRPFLYRLAEECGIRGTVKNSWDGLVIRAEGAAPDLERFIGAILNRCPELARVEEFKVTEMPRVGFESFSIVGSDAGGESALSIPPDTAVCETCLREMRDPGSRFFRYPFINCTECGPRYSIIREMPYDRPSTSMDAFEWCDDCRDDYEDARDRRFHAQPIACGRCGPKLRLLDAEGNVLAERDAAVELAKKKLKERAIVAVKGIGGYHLACDALSSEVVARLREKKRRPYRPLALMASSLESCEMIGILSKEEKKLLASPERPIVIVRARNRLLLPEEVAPRMRSIGLMLPYTPLHHLLLEDEDLPFLVMTSANSSGLPILYQDAEALKFLASASDYILTHDREIANPIEDSVLQWKEGRIDFLRRGRGYGHDPLASSEEAGGIVALGGQQKNAPAIGRGKRLFLAPPNGDLGSLEMERHGRRQFENWLRLHGVAPRLAAIDRHPDYSTQALVRNTELSFVPVQHHHAHHVSCMADHGLTERCYGLVLDGTGYGEDGCIWGFELLHADADGFERLGHLRYTPLPGGEACIRQPWRTAVATVMALLPRSGEGRMRSRYPDKGYEIGLIRAMLDKNVNVPLAGTCGRLFDAVSSLLGLCDVSTYEGEAAVVLSELVAYYEGEAPRPYPFSIQVDEGLPAIDLSRMFHELLRDMEYHVPVETVALRFHETVADAAVRLLLHAHRDRPGRRKEVVLSGGGFHNRYLSGRVRAKLEELGFACFFHERVPCDDGGLAQGQLIVAARAAARINKEQEG